MSFNPNQPRDDEGKWVASGGASGRAPSKSDIDFFKKKLKSINDASLAGLDQVARDPDLPLIARKGKLQDAKTAKFCDGMPDGLCHWNVSKLFEEGKVDSVVLGYARSPDQQVGTGDSNWHQHTWGLKDGAVVETTRSNKGNKFYFGVSLSKEESKRFAEWTRANPPGGGKVRMVPLNRKK